ncbi:hypothetical protein SIN8267_00605 [Sinobacterium norvegicum]|uniref:Uncharacterized protein n=1 Tax=Sinobacterium norvegicum TaxID=1641715 RepID=A0ABN8EDH3_9GAMM|nr:hypothetical protein [Sinobacterium norvegicum]CAH0990513.1 hypothetical protein SIN8267_00605 [Sinobacterium norvegicum]
MISGIGNSKASFTVYIGNTPPLSPYQQLTSISPLLPGEIAHIANETGNHWRKVFNVFAKLLFQLNSSNHTSWQQLRDNELLQANSHQRMIFSPHLNPSLGLDIIAGKHHGLSMVESSQLDWLDNDFALHRQRDLIVTPYFDYRQLSNHKIDTLCRLIESL